MIKNNVTYKYYTWFALVLFIVICIMVVSIFIPGSSWAKDEQAPAPTNEMSNSQVEAMVYRQ